MKVTDKNNPTPMDGATKSNSTRRKTSSSSVTTSKTSLDDIGSAKVKLSERVQDAKKIRAAVDKTPDVDEAKVAKYKSLINSGQYKVDANKVADKMVDEHFYNEILNGED